MTDYRYMLLSSSEDGNPVRWLDAARLRALLDDPGSFGIDRFVGPDDVQTDPNYWPSDVGILLRVEVVEPVPSGAYRLPDGIEPPTAAQVSALNEGRTLRLGDVIG